MKLKRKVPYTVVDNVIKPKTFKISKLSDPLLKSWCLVALAIGFLLSLSIIMDHCI